jgi:hypothetical protein
MRLTILVDVIAIAAGVAIILAAADDGSDHTAGHCSNGSSRTRADARKD